MKVWDPKELWDKDNVLVEVDVRTFWRWVNIIKEFIKDKIYEFSK